MSEYPEIPGYKIKKKLGQGGMATVFMGVPRNLGKVVAIKLISSLAFGNPRLAKRFTKEAKTLAKLSHPNIVAIDEVGEVNECNYIVMEFLQDSLKERIRNDGKIAPDEALHITAQIADALFYAHENSIVHRDIKPDNIMFRKDGTAVLLDFGIAKHMDSTTKITRTGTSVGTPQYMSPEQCNAEDIDGRSDIYSLGVVLFEMLTGRAPYRHKTTMGIINQHLADDIPQLPKRLQQYQPIIDKMMVKERKRRVRSMGGLMSIIKELLNVNTGRIPVANGGLQNGKSRSKKKGNTSAQDALTIVTDAPAKKKPAAKSAAKSKPKTKALSITRKNAVPRSSQPRYQKKSNKKVLFRRIVIGLGILVLLYFILPGKFWDTLFSPIKDFFGPTVEYLSDG